MAGDLLIASDAPLTDGHASFGEDWLLLRELLLCKLQAKKQMTIKEQIKKIVYIEINKIIYIYIYTYKRTQYESKISQAL